MLKMNAKDQIAELSLVDYAIVVGVYLFEQLVELIQKSLVLLKLEV